MEDLEISWGKNKSDTKFKVEYSTWSEFVDKLRSSVRTTGESVSQYNKMSKDQRGKIKDGPCYVGGFVKAGRRTKKNVESRSILTLDADNADADFAFAVDSVLAGHAYLIYSTHSYRASEPRYRLIVLPDRSVSPDEYSAMTRKLAENIGLHFFDKGSFEAERLMYVPSHSKDGEFIFDVSEGDALSVDSVLDEYLDWTDVSEWPRTADDKPKLSGHDTMAQRPQNKPGMIGKLCRAYTIEAGIEEFLKDVYEKGTMENRFTYKFGSSANGLEVYPDQGLAFSYQDSDPVAGGYTHNLFDLIRIHLFGHLDVKVKVKVKEDTNPMNLPSQLAMMERAALYPAVKRLIVNERNAELQEMADTWDEIPEDEEDVDPDAWMDKLDMSKKGDMLPTAGNVEILLSRGPWQGTMAFNEFSNTEVVKTLLPWRNRELPDRDYEPWLASDDRRLQHWISKAHNINSIRIITNALTEVSRVAKFHPIKDYLEEATWDGKKRAENLFIDYLGAANTHYTRQITRKMLLAAVSRIYRPGCKFDQMLVLVGPQGAHKSSILAKLGARWFSDSLRTFDNKEAGEHLQNAWIFEIGELSALNKTEVEEVKAFLSKTEDRYRVAYDRQVSDFPRKCIFFGTTNTKEFLRDPTGNRRFWPLDVDPTKAKLSHWDHLGEYEVQQVWAEVYQWFKSNESLLLDDKAHLAAEREQNAHMMIDPKEGMLRSWLDEEEMEEDLPTGRARTQVCAVQVWTDCFNKRRGDISAWESKNIADLLRRVGWKEKPGRITVNGYGRQNVFEKADE